ncbi:MAG: hypothetical protein H8E61_00295, partial [Bacteroidetes bacterium]|nr:hypothetical protein [Bacteroidota bacterium]
SGKYVLDDKENTKGIEYAKTDGFNFYLYVTDKNNKVISTYPGSKPYFFSWEEWDIPTYSKRLKPIYYELKDYFKVLNPLPATDTEKIESTSSFRITDYYNNKSAALSLVFNDAGFTQISNALPVVTKYYFRISFGITEKIWNQNTSNYSDEGSFSIRRFGINEIKDMLGYKHEFSLYFPQNQNPSDLQAVDRLKKELEQKTKRKVRSGFWQQITQQIQHPDLLFGVNLNPSNNINKPGSIVFRNLSSYRMTNEFPKQYQLDSILKQGNGSWMIFSYYNFFKADSKEQKLINSSAYSNTYSVTPYIFERQARLFRNSDYWIAPVSLVGKYLVEKENSRIISSQFGNMIFLTVQNNLDNSIYQHPLTVEFTSEAGKIKVTGSAYDGIYHNRNGKLYLNVYPNREVKIEIL